MHIENDKQKNNFFVGIRFLTYGGRAGRGGGTEGYEDVRN